MSAGKLLLSSVVIGIVVCLLFGYVGDAEPRKMVALGTGLGICGWLLLLWVAKCEEEERLEKMAYEGRSAAQERDWAKLTMQIQKEKAQ
jgi:hypothetical protein